MPEITYEVPITRTHKYTETWKRTQLICPQCGWRGLLSSNADNAHVCVHCEAFMFLEFETREITQGVRHQARLAALGESCTVPMSGPEVP